MKPNNTVSCRFSTSEVEILDKCIEKGMFRNRSDAVRGLVWKAMEIYNLRKIGDIDHVMED